MGAGVAFFDVGSLAATLLCSFQLGVCLPACLQGVPDAVHFAGTTAACCYKQIGNAVPVPLAAMLGWGLLGPSMRLAEQLRLK
jgi:hypothetical protein